MDLHFLAAFGDHVPLSNFKPDDTISAMAFSSDGQFLASGDQAGRVVVFRLNENGKRQPTVSFVTQVHAHKAQFDYFHSELSEMKVNSLKWVPRQALNPLLITCNSHDAKLWRFNASPKIVWNEFDDCQLIDDSFIFPTFRQKDTEYSAECVKTFNDIQTEYIVDLQTLPDQHSFIMVDVSCVKLWDMERDIKSVCLCKVSQQEPEIITSAIHSSQPHAFIIGDDDGVCKMFDMRQQAEDIPPLFEIYTSDFASRNQQMSGCDSVGSIVFSPDGNNFAVRRFGDVQVWDIRNTSSPTAKLDVQWFPGQMEWLINEEYVKDQFRTAFTAKGKIVTGCYSADYIAWDWKNNKTSKHRAVGARTPRPPPEPGRDFSKRVTVCEAHPKDEIVAVVSTAALFFFYEPK
ncbi:Protein phosphatase PP2A regulatory subunit B [Histomonas meleagridis]|uniref:Protein phosphatase PP2A regulatory subunit B n=1 Tax=Histomonas meleagridis TaxID=135588 RepID=UPI003559E171|nr:Protein phosphatase PP2A regulatory subunit B [Histomonas meleagridis]KAH0803762.1 Protein phosphatase PP2A regulatory subunit B [Histomonas meleagridis]